MQALLLTILKDGMPVNYASKYQDSNGLQIYTQNEEQRKIGYQIIASISNRWTPRSYFYHLLPGGHVAAVRSHLYHKYFARADLKKFFNNVTRRKISRALGGIGISYDIVQDVVAHSTVFDSEANSRHVPFGFVQSPLLATLTLHKSAVGDCLKKLGQSNTIALSVYMDDILLSSDSPEELSGVIEELLEASRIANFPINEKKLVMPCEALEIFNIALSKQNMEIIPSRLIEFEETITQGATAEVIYGIVSYVHTVNKPQGIQLEALLPQ